MGKEEIWKDVLGYEGLYEVSSLGSIKNLITGKKMKVCICGNNYHGLGLTRNGNQKTFYVHRLVAQAFIPNPERKKTVNHKNENRLDNRLDNLEWMTQHENNIYSDVYNRTGIGSPRRVIQKDLNGVFIRSWDSVYSTANGGYSRRSVGKVARGEQENHKGFIWEYVNG